MNKLMSAALAAMILSVTGCTLHGPSTAPGPGTDSPPPPAGGSPVSKSHPRFAPPPGASSHWDGALGVYVLESERDTFYRERTFYRWSNGWNRAGSLQGPWEVVDSSGIPPALYRRYAP